MQEEMEKKEGHFVHVHEIAVIPEIGRSQGYRFGPHFLCLLLKVAGQVPSFLDTLRVDGVHGVSPGDDKMILESSYLDLLRVLLHGKSLAQATDSCALPVQDNLFHLEELMPSINGVEYS
ncbi:hypothetical protein ACSBR2_010000 [Camellia fascicularis]